MKTVSLWFGILASIAVGCALQGLNLSALVQVPAALIVFGPVVCCLLFLCGPRGTASFIKRVFNANAKDEDRAVAKQLCSVAYLCGAIAFLTGMVHVLSHLDQPATIGAGVAVAIAGMLYGCIPALLLLPVVRDSAPMNSSSGRPHLHVAASFAGVSLMVTTVLYALSRFN